MGEYQHFIRKNEAMVIIHGFSSAFEQPQTGDYLIGDNDTRHFHEFFPDRLINERGQFTLKWVNDKVTPRTKQELDEEWANRPPSPPSIQEQIDEMKVTLGDFILFGGV